MPGLLGDFPGENISVLSLKRLKFTLHVVDDSTPQQERSHIGEDENPWLYGLQHAFS